jgi:hypothetical protein
MSTLIGAAVGRFCVLQVFSSYEQTAQMECSTSVAEFLRPPVRHQRSGCVATPLKHHAETGRRPRMTTVSAAAVGRFRGGEIALSLE